MSLDNVESSNPNLKAAHAGASTRKTRRLQPSASNAADAEGGLICLFKTRVPHSYSSSRGKSPQNNILSMTSFEERATACLIGSFAADAASLGTHWIYDVSKMAEVLTLRLHSLAVVPSERHMLLYETGREGRDGTRVHGVGRKHSPGAVLHECGVPGPLRVRHAVPLRRAGTTRRFT